MWYLEGPKQNNAKIIILRYLQCALVHYILQRCYQLLLLTVINGYQLFLVRQSTYVRRSTCVRECTVRLHLIMCTVIHMFHELTTCVE